MAKEIHRYPLIFFNNFEILFRTIIVSLLNKIKQYQSTLIKIHTHKNRISALRNCPFNMNNLKDNFYNMII